jgi:hypothetical protein
LEQERELNAMIDKKVKQSLATMQSSHTISGTKHDRDKDDLDTSDELQEAQILEDSLEELTLDEVQVSPEYFGLSQI